MRMSPITTQVRTLASLPNSYHFPKMTKVRRVRIEERYTVIIIEIIGVSDIYHQKPQFRRSIAGIFTLTWSAREHLVDIENEYNVGFIRNYEHIENSSKRLWLIELRRESACKKPSTNENFG